LSIISNSNIGEKIVQGAAYAGLTSEISPLFVLGVIAKAAGRALGAYTAYSLFESAASDILCLKTFRHGTNVYAHARILFEGPDYNRAGRDGEAKFNQVSGNLDLGHYAERDAEEKLFYVVEDVFSGARLSYADYVQSYISTKLTTKYYSLRSTIAFSCSLIPLPTGLTRRVSRAALGLLENEVTDNARLLFRAVGLMTPTVKFHVPPEKVTIIPCCAYPGFSDVRCSNFGRFYLESGKLLFSRDECSSLQGGPFEGALATKYRFTVMDVGFLGIVKNGVNRDLFERIRSHKGQFLWGCAQLVYAVGFTAILLGVAAPGLVPYSIPLIYILDPFNGGSGLVSQCASYLYGIPFVILGTYTLMQL